MNLNLKIIGLLLVIALTSCQQRYWYRNKIDNGTSKKYSVKINMVNEAPGFIEQSFVDVMRKAAAKELRKKGYFEVPIDSPQFLFTLTIKVDSFNAGVKYFTKSLATYTEKPADAPYAFKRTVKAILFQCEMKSYKRGRRKWEISDDIYYFGEYRDIGRSEGMVRYLIKTVKD
jgi:hypothetical protein